jgi:hypothetical protein
MAHRIPAPAKAGKAASAAVCTVLEQIPNIGASLAADLRSIGIAEPRDLVGRDPYTLYVALCERSGQRQDPCVLDSFMAATDFMDGAAPAPWWRYTAQRKERYGQLGAHGSRPDASTQAARATPLRAAPRGSDSAMARGRTP